MPGYDHRLTDIEAFTLESTLIKYRACKTGTVTGAVTAITATTDIVKGISVEDGATGENHGIAQSGGRVLVEAGAAIAAEAEVMIDSVGRVITWTASAGTNVLCLGRVLEAAGASGDVVPLRLLPYTKQG